MRSGPPPRPSRWILIRHGESVANAEGWLAGHYDAGLTDRGREQALALAARGLRPDRLFVSDLTRARLTAELGLPGAPEPVVSPRLRERHLGVWERKEKAWLREQGHWERLLTWDQGPPEGESQRDVAIRMLSYLAEIDSHGVTAVVSHGTALRTVIGLLEGMDPHAIGRTALGNTEVVERELAVGTWAELLRAL